MGLMAWIGQGLAGCAKMIALPFAKLGCPHVRPYVRWTLHVACVLAILGCLAWLNAAFQLDKVVRAPWPWLRATWLPLLFLFVYALAWMAWWLWRVATSPSERSPFPDLDDAWSAGLEALDQAKIDLLRTPIYLLIGNSAERVEGWARATGWKWEAPLTPRRATSPLRLCATADAIFVDLSQTSTSSRFVSQLLNHQAAVSEAARQAALERPTITLATAAGEGGGVLTRPAAATHPTAQRGLELIEQSLALLETDRVGQEEEAALEGFHVGEEELAAAEERLAHFCHLLADARAPFCPANGVLTLIAWETTASNSASNRLAVLLDRDLTVVSKTLRIVAPRLALVTDLDVAGGGPALIDRIPLDQRQRRFGVRFPRVALADAGNWPRLVEEGVRWMTRELLPALAYRVLQIGNEHDQRGEAWRGNAGVFHLLNAARERESRLTRLLTRGLLPSLGGGVLGGVYLCANSNDDPHAQAFLPGLMPQVLEMQNDVAWSPEALANDARARRWTTIGYALLAALVAGLAALAWTV